MMRLTEERTVSGAAARGPTGVSGGVRRYCMQAGRHYPGTERENVEL